MENWVWSQLSFEWFVVQIPRSEWFLSLFGRILFYVISHKVLVLKHSSGALRIIRKAYDYDDAMHLVRAVQYDGIWK